MTLGTEVESPRTCSRNDHETAVKLVWDLGGSAEEVIASTHGDANLELVRQVAGDGAKKLALVLENDSLAARVLGGRYEAREL